MSQTLLKIVNGSSQPVVVYLTLGAEAGNTTLADLAGFVKPVPGNSLQGTFTLASKASQAYASSAGTSFIGNLCFGSPPINCPTSQFPNAVNLFEFALNVPYGGQETVDISCVAGVNAELAVTLAGGVGWNAGPTQPSVFSFANGKRGTNTGRVGVYPVGCDICWGSQSPPVCNPAVPREAPQSQAICNVQRPVSTQGGAVTVTYNGQI